MVRPDRPSGNRSFIESRETRADAVDDRSRRARSETHAIETLLSRAHRRAFPGINPVHTRESGCG